MTARLLGLILLIAVALRLACFTGLMGSDDLDYRASARGILEGKPPVGEFSHSVAPGMAVPMALSYAMLGPGEVGTAAFPLVLSLLHVLAAFLLGRRLFSDRAGLLAALLMAVYPLEVVLSTQALPDVPLAVCGGLAVLAFLRGEEARLSGRECSRAFLLCGLLVGLGYLAKVTAVFVTLFLALYAIVKWRFSLRWALAAGSFLVVLLAETLYYRALTGQWFYRPKAILHTNVVITGPGGYKTSLLEYPYYFFLNPQRCGLYFFVGVPAAVAAVLAWMRRRRETKAPAPIAGDASIPLLWFAAVFGYLEFGVESFRPPLFIHKEIRFTTQITLPLILILAGFLANGGRGLRLSLSTLLVATSIPFAAVAAAAHRSAFSNARAIASDLRREPEKDVYASYYEAQYLRFFLGPGDENRIRPFNDRSFEGTFPVDLSRVRDAYVVLDQETDEGHAARARGGFQLPREVVEIPPPWRAIHEYPRRSTPFLSLVRDGSASLLRVAPFSERTGARISSTVRRTVEIGPAAIYEVP